MSGLEKSAPQLLKREIGVFQATLLGLGSILGTGVFVSIGIATEVAGNLVVFAIPLAAIVALCNGISSAQLAGNHPVSGGTYEYGYRWLTPSLGFSAGWMFLCAKSASAATAALGFAAYFRTLFAVDEFVSTRVLALLCIAVLTVTVLMGIRRSSMVNMVIVFITVFSLIWLIVWGARSVDSSNLAIALSTETFQEGNLFEAIALMFVAYTGYGRIATLGEEIHEPRKNIPVTILVALGVTACLYTLIAVVAVGCVGSSAVANATRESGAPLQFVAQAVGLPGASFIIQCGAMTAMLGVLLNLILGLSRVVLAMGRRGDLPRSVSKINRTGETPFVAVLVVATIIATIATIGSLKLTWSFSAFTVLIYYSLTNLSALRLTDEERMYPRFISWCGLCSCLFLAPWVDPAAWGTGLGLLAAGLLWRKFVKKRNRQFTE